MSYRAFNFYGTEQDSLILLQKGTGDKYGVIFLKLPIYKDKIAKKDVRIIPIYSRILKDGSKIKDSERSKYLLDNFKKVPVEVIDYENIISDY